MSRTPRRSCAVGRRELLGQEQLVLGEIELMYYSKWTYNDKNDAKSVYPLNNDVHVTQVSYMELGKGQSAEHSDLPCEIRSELGEMIS